MRITLVVFLLSSACAEVDERAIVPPQEGFGEAQLRPPAAAGTTTAPAPSTAPQASAVVAPSAPARSELPTSRAPRRPSPGDDDDPVIVEDPTLSTTERGVLRAVALCLRNEKPGRGSLALELTLEADGRVRDVTFGPGYTKPLERCVEPRVKAVRYPAAPEGGLRVIKIPINEASVDEADGGD